MRGTSSPDNWLQAAVHSQPNLPENMLMPATSTKTTGQAVCYLGGKTQDIMVHSALSTAWISF